MGQGRMTRSRTRSRVTRAVDGDLRAVACTKGLDLQYGHHPLAVHLLDTGPPEAANRLPIHADLFGLHKAPCLFVHPEPNARKAFNAYIGLHEDDDALLPVHAFSHTFLFVGGIRPP